MTHSVHNPIFIGFEWEQEIVFPAGVIAPGAELHVQIRSLYSPDTFVDPAIEQVEETTFRISLAEEQTADFKIGRVVADLVAVEGGENRHLGTRLIIPVVASFTEPKP